MKRFRCHKEVDAARIRRVEISADPKEPAAVYIEGSEEPILVEAPRRSRVADAEPGWYLVRYDGGYLSASPGEIFEEGYTEIDADLPEMNLRLRGGSFGWALDRLKAGHRVARSGWNGKGMWIALGEGHPNLPADYFWNRHARTFAGQNGGVAEVLPYILFKTADGKILMGWLASQSDMLAEDWELVQ